MSSSGEDADAQAGVLEPAWALRWRAPELALALAERAAATTADPAVRLRAEALAVSASCRLGGRLAVVARAIDAVQAAAALPGGAPELTARLRIELAGCARAAGVPLAGVAVLRPVLTDPDIAELAPALRAGALVQLAECLAGSDRQAELDALLGQADQLYAEDRALDRDTVLVLRALLRSVAAAAHRRRGRNRAAIETSVAAAQEGVALLDQLGRPDADAGLAAARLAVQLVLALLDLGRVDQARALAKAALAGPVRAPAAGPIGWLALALATRVHLPAGLLGPAAAVLAEVVALATRYDRTDLHAAGLTALAHTRERAGDLAETLDCLRSAQAVRLRRGRAVHSARTALIGAFGEVRHAEDLLDRLVPHPRRHPVIPAAVAVPTTPDPMTPDPMTVVLLDVQAGVVPDEPLLRLLTAHVRQIAPAHAEIAQVGGAALAVLFPGHPRAAVERWADELRAAVTGTDWSGVAPGLAVTIRTTPATAVPTPRQPTAPFPGTARAAGSPSAAAFPGVPAVDPRYLDADVPVSGFPGIPGLAAEPSGTGSPTTAPAAAPVTSGYPAIPETPLIAVRQFDPAAFRPTAGTGSVDDRPTVPIPPVRTETAGTNLPAPPMMPSSLEPTPPAGAPPAAPWSPAVSAYGSSAASAAEQAAAAMAGWPSSAPDEPSAAGLPAVPVMPGSLEPPVVPSADTPTPRHGIPVQAPESTPEVPLGRHATDDAGRSVLAAFGISAAGDPTPGRRRAPDAPEPTDADADVSAGRRRTPESPADTETARRRAPDPTGDAETGRRRASEGAQAQGGRSGAPEAAGGRRRAPDADDEGAAGRRRAPEDGTTGGRRRAPEDTTDETPAARRRAPEAVEESGLGRRRAPEGADEAGAGRRRAPQGGDAEGGRRRASESADDAGAGRRRAPDTVDEMGAGRREVPEPWAEAAGGRRRAPESDVADVTSGRRHAPESADELGRRWVPEPGNAGGRRRAPEPGSDERPAADEPHTTVAAWRQALRGEAPPTGGRRRAPDADPVPPALAAPPGPTTPDLTAPGFSAATPHPTTAPPGPPAFDPTVAAPPGPTGFGPAPYGFEPAAGPDPTTPRPPFGATPPAPAHPGSRAFDPVAPTTARPGVAGGFGSGSRDTGAAPTDPIAPPVFATPPDPVAPPVFASPPAPVAPPAFAASAEPSRTEPSGTAAADGGGGRRRRADGPAAGGIDPAALVAQRRRAQGVTPAELGITPTGTGGRRRAPDPDEPTPPIGTPVWTDTDAGTEPDQVPEPEPIPSTPQPKPVPDPDEPGPARPVPGRPGRPGAPGDPARPVPATPGDPGDPARPTPATPGDPGDPDPARPVPGSPAGVSPLDLGHYGRAAEPQAAEPRAAEPRAAEPRAAEPQGVPYTLGAMGDTDDLDTGRTPVAQPPGNVSELTGNVSELRTPGGGPIGPGASDAHGRRRTRSEAKLGDLLSEALLAYQEVRDATGDDSLDDLAEPEPFRSAPRPGRTVRHRSVDIPTNPRWELPEAD